MQNHTVVLLEGIPTLRLLELAGVHAGVKAFTIQNQIEWQSKVVFIFG